MAKLALCFREKKECRPLTSDEILDVTRAALGASAIIRVMAHYACDSLKGGEHDTSGVYGCVFKVLELLMEPVTDYLCDYAGEPAVKEPEQGAEEQEGEATL